MATHSTLIPGVVTTEDLLEYIHDTRVEAVDLNFVDAFGRWHCCTYAAEEMSMHSLSEGFAFDGSSVPLFTSIEHSDVIMKPDISSCWLDPFREIKVLHLTCSVFLPNGKELPDCPRNIAKRAVTHMKESDIGTEAIFGPEAEFFIFEDVRYSTSKQHSSYEVDSAEGPWNTNRKTDGPRVNACPTNLANRNTHGWYLELSPYERMQRVREDMFHTMKNVGIRIEKHHHEVGSNQHEIGYRCTPLVRCADVMMMYKYIVKNVAQKHMMSATFMPKPLYGEAGNGMHCHQSLWKNEVNTFFDASNDLGLSETALYYIGGLLKHAKAVFAFTNPTTNSYKRLVPGYEAPVGLAYSKGNRSAAIRIPDYDQKSMRAKRIEFRCPDASSCPYLAFAAMLQAGLDGIKNKITPPPKVETSLYAALDSSIERTPTSLREALEALSVDYEFMTAGGVFTKGFIDEYIKMKYAEIKACDIVPTPKEYELYYRC